MSGDGSEGRGEAHRGGLRLVGEPPEPDDETDAARARLGDVTALHALEDRWGGRLRGLLALVAGRGVATVDTAARAGWRLALHRDAARSGGPATFRALLLKGALAALPGAGTWEDGDDAPRRPEADPPDARDVALWAATRGRLEDAVRALPPRDRAALLAYHGWGLGPGEVAVALGVEADSVPRRLARGLGSLRAAAVAK